MPPTDRPVIPPCFPELAHINRYWDGLHRTIAAKILPGEYYVTDRDEAIVTVLGSCVSACVRDPIAGIGGMNHFMLPEASRLPQRCPPSLSAAARYGSFAMEQLINAVLERGGRRQHLEVKLFGGGRVLRAVSDIGARNIAFVRHYVDMEGLRVAAADLGGDLPRKVYYFPASGRVRLKRLKRLANRTLLEREANYRRRISETPTQGDVELF